MESFFSPFTDSVSLDTALFILHAALVDYLHDMKCYGLQTSSLNEMFPDLGGVLYEVSDYKKKNQEYQGENDILLFISCKR